MGEAFEQQFFTSINRAAKLGKQLWDLEHASGTTQLPDVMSDTLVVLDRVIPETSAPSSGAASPQQGWPTASTRGADVPNPPAENFIEKSLPMFLARPQAASPQQSLPTASTQGADVA